MKFNQLVQDLALGELQGTPLVETGEFQINAKFLPKLISVLNRSLEHFYSVFPLSEKQILIELKDGISHYYLDRQYAYSNHEVQGIKYIIDNDLNPFDNDVLQVIEVSTIDGRSLAMNDIHSQFGVLIPQPNCIHVPYDLGIKQLSIVYQASHQVIPLSEPATSNMEINIPIAMHGAFMAYVACLVLQNMGGNKLNESNAFYAKYQTLMEVLKQQGIGIKTQTGTNIKPYIREWI